MFSISFGVHTLVLGLYAVMFFEGKADQTLRDKLQTAIEQSLCLLLLVIYGSQVTKGYPLTIWLC